MPTDPKRAWPVRLPAIAATFVIAITGGLAFAALQIPAAWLSGPATAVAIAVIAGFKSDVPSELRSLSLLFLGSVMGASVTPDTIGQLAQSPLTVAGLFVCLGAVMISITCYLRFVHKFDALTAQLGAAPGASLYVLALAEETGADIRRVAIVQMIRLVALIILLPSIFAILGYAGDVAASPVATRAVHWPHIAVLGVSALVLACVFEWLRVPTGIMFGAMVAGGLLFGSGTITTGLPEWLMLPGFVVIGAVVGSNFQGTTRQQFGETLLAGVGTVVVGSIASLSVAVPFAFFAELPLAQMWLAYAPGGVDTMSVLALAIGLEPAFVAAHHLARFLCLALFLPFWFRGHIQAQRAKS
ncbi:MAG: membrane AbrB-like protein [Hyphomicrobiaceae bacterium]|jgi:membrane AbrB-like protein